MQFIDLHTQYEALKEDINHAIHTVLSCGQYIMGKEVNELEGMLSDFIHMKHSITCANGTDALQMVLMAYDIGVGDAVFCPDVTFIASVEPACMLGATPVFCDIEKDTYNLCAKSLESRINKVICAGVHNPKAVIAVDFLGNPCDYDAIKEVCNKYGLLLIEDAAQSFGAEYRRNKCCSLGDIATTSFFPAKPLGCYGDGGAIFTNDDYIAEVLKSIRVHGKGRSKYDNIRVGVNSRLDTIQAAILKVKLKALAEHELENRQVIAERYDTAFKGEFVTPFVREEAMSAYAQYALLAKDTEQRNYIFKNLEQKGIPCMVYYPNPMHKQEVFKNNPYLHGDFRISSEYCGRTFSIPYHPYLTEADQEKIINVVLECV